MKSRWDSKVALRLAAVLGADGAINLFRRRGDADAVDEVGGHNYFCSSQDITTGGQRRFIQTNCYHPIFTRLEWPPL
jgi:hypothetical protein